MRWPPGNRSGSFRDDNPLVPEPARFVGSPACASVSSHHLSSQQNSRHARTFFRASELGSLDLPAAPMSDPGQPDVSHMLSGPAATGCDKRPRSKARVSRDRRVRIRSGDRGLTLVGREDNGQARELRLSHYHSEAGSFWDVTSGHLVHPPRSRPKTWAKPDGRRGPPLLFCHVTNPRAVLEELRPEASDRGIGCEKCHGPGGNHLLAVAAKFPDLAIARPRWPRARASSSLCGQCHSPLGQDGLAPTTDRPCASRQRR